MSKDDASKRPGEQPYDSSFKGLIDDVPVVLLSFLFGEQIVQVQELKESLLKEGTVQPALRADCAYLITRLREQELETYVGNVECETVPSNDIEVRLLEYFIRYYRRHNKPVKQVLLCPFETANLPESPHHIALPGEPIMVHHYRVVAMWLRHVDELLGPHNVELYALLPTMRGATAEKLIGAIQEMKNFWRGQESRLRRHLLWFDTFLRRTTMVSQADKERVYTVMSEYHGLLEEGYFVQERMAQGREEGRREGREEGREAGLAEGEARGREEGHEAGLAEGLQEAATFVIETRFPSLSQQAQEKVRRIHKSESLRLLLKGMRTARDEEVARFLLDMFSAA